MEKRSYTPFFFYLLKILGIAGLYFVTAKLGLSLAFTTKQVTTVWPPTGIALAAVLIFGYRYWPGIFLGAFVINFLTNEPLLVALGIAVGNTLEAVIGAYLVCKFVPHFNRSLKRASDYLGFLFLAGIVSPIISATIGVASLTLANLVDHQAFFSIWKIWWSGDLMGSLVVAPIFLTLWYVKTFEISHKRIGEFMGLLVVTITFNLFVFNHPATTGILSFPSIYIFPLVIWTALRFYQPGTAIIVAITSVIAITGTLHGSGPFIREANIESNLLTLQYFLGMVSIASMTMACVVFEHRMTKLKLEKEMGARDKFIALISHELRNPMAPLVTTTEILQLQTKDNPAIKELADIISRQLKQITRLLDDLLDVSRMMHGKIKLDLRPVIIENVIRDSVETVEPAIKKSLQELEVMLPKNPISLVADPLRLRQIIINLLTNANKYTPARGRIVLEVKEVRNNLVITVKDTGIGIHPNMLSNIFELFKQASISMDQANGGLGIGLNLVKTLTELHGGRVSVQSRGIRQGSQFSVYIPIHPSDQFRIKTESSKSPAINGDTEGLHKKKVLIVDDNQDAAISLSKLLGKMNYTVRLAYDGFEALDVLREFNPRVMLIDIAMPHMSGHELVKKVREQHEGDIILIAVTGFGQADDREKSRASGFDYHLIKPINTKELVEIIEAS